MRHRFRQLWQLLKKPFRIALAVAMILIGILGWIFPILPGWIFFVPGLVLLAPNTRFSRWVKRKAYELQTRWAHWRGHEPPEPLPPDDNERPKTRPSFNRRRYAPMAPDGAHR